MIKASREANHLFTKGGEVGRLMQGIDWSATALGACGFWSQSLYTSLSICLASPLPMLMGWGSDLVLLYNDAYRLLSSHLLLGQRACEQPQIGRAIGTALEGVMASGNVVELRQQISVDRNGKLELCEFTFSCSPILDEVGNVAGVFGVAVERPAAVVASLEEREAEIRQQAAEAIHQSEERYHSLVAATSQVVWLGDSNGKLVSAPLWEALTGQTPQQYQGWGWAERVHPADRLNAAEKWMRAFQAKVRHVSEFRVQYQDGNYHFVIAQAVPVLNADGSVREWVGTLTDTTDRKRAEQVLEQTNQMLRTLINACPVAIACFDSQGIVRLWNHSAERIFGWTAEEAIGQFMPTVPHQAEQFMETVQAVLAGQLLQNFEAQHLRKDGSIVELEIWAVPLRDTEGSPLCLSIALDITERKQAEERLRQQALIFEKISDGVVLTDRQGHITAMNAGAEKIFGYTQAEAIGKTPALWHRAEESETMTSAILSVLQQTKDWRGELNFVRQDGSEGVADLNVVPIQDEQGEMVATVGINHDVTERKQAEHLLQETVQRLNFHVENSPLGVIEWDCNFRVIRWSKEAERIFGWRAEEVLGRRYDEWQFIMAEDSTQLNALIKQILVDNEQQTVSHSRNYAKDGSVLYCEWYNSTLTDAEASVVSVLSLVLDVSDRVQLGIERDRILKLEQAARQEAERANHVKDEFLAVLSHELRTPLNPILGWAKLLQTRKFDAQTTAAALATIERNAKLQTQLIEDLLDVSRILQGKLVLNSVPVRLEQVVAAAQETVWLAAEAKGIQIETKFEANSGWVLGDSARLQQVVWNLLSNAVKFTPEGGQVKVEIAETTAVEGQHVQLQVSDTGKGISPNFLPCVFDYFRQADSATTRKFGGLGLGLAIVRQIVELHGGTVAAESAGEGQGAKFTVTLPLLKADQQLETPVPASIPAACLQGLRVLAVDDDADSREFIAFALEQEGAHVVAVASAPEALEAVTQFHPHLLVSDISMPEVDGYMLIQQIKTQPLSQQIPAIALSAYAGELDQQRAKQAGFQSHLSKPLDMAALIEAIVRLMAAAGQPVGGFG